MEDLLGIQTDTFDETEDTNLKERISDTPPPAYVPKVEDAMWFVSREIPTQKTSELSKYKLDCMYHNKQYQECIDFIIPNYAVDESNLIAPKKRDLQEIYEILMWCYYNMDKWENVLPLLRVLLEIKPQHFLFWRLLGNANMNLGNFDEAGKCYFFSIKYNLNYIDAWLDVSNYYLQTNNTFLAKKCFSNTKFLLDRFHPQKNWNFYNEKLKKIVEEKLASLEMDKNTNVQFHTDPVIAKMEKEFLEKKYNLEEGKEEEKEQEDNPMNL